MFFRERFAPLVPFAGVVAVYGLYRQIYAWTRIGAIDPAVPGEAWRLDLDTTASVADLGARLIWGVATLTLIIASIVTAWVCFGVIVRSATGRLRMGLVAGAAITAGSGIMAGLRGNPLTLPRVADELETGFSKMGLVE